MGVVALYTFIDSEKVLIFFLFFQLVHKWREAQIGVKIFKLIFPSLINPLRSFVQLSCHANLDTIRVSPPSRGQKRYVWVQVLHYGLIIFKKKKDRRWSVSFTIRFNLPRPQPSFFLLDLCVYQIKFPVLALPLLAKRGLKESDS